MGLDSTLTEKAADEGASGAGDDRAGAREAEPTGKGGRGSLATRPRSCQGGQKLGLEKVAIVVLNRAAVERQFAPFVPENTAADGGQQISRKGLSNAGANSLMADDDIDSARFQGWVRNGKILDLERRKQVANDANALLTAPASAIFDIDTLPGAEQTNFSPSFCEAT